MTDVMQRCVPLSTGALGPDLRVNYQFGMVLGVDEFEQEDLYLRTRDERHARSLHGYGTVSGLDVTLAIPQAAPDDVEVRVSEGIGVDQFGRPIVIRSAQCGRVGAWIADEEKRAAADKVPSPLAAHRSPSGDVTIYVVVSYASCTDALIPLPGNPCGSDDEVTAPSRIRDSWNLEFRWERPAMPAWDGIRALADLLLPIELDDSSPVVSDEDVLAAHIRALVPESPAPGSAVPDPPLLPRAEGRAALDRLLTIWATEVRPTLAPDLIDPEGEAGILLSTVTLVPALAFDTAHPVIASFGDADDEGRPYLAPTQLIQELTLLGGGTATILAGSPIVRPTTRPLIELASLGTALAATGARRLVLVHNLERPLVLPQTVSVRRGGGAPVNFATESTRDGSRWFLNPPPGSPLQDLEMVRLDLKVPELGVRNDARGTVDPLTSFLERAGVDLVGRVGDVVTLDHQVPPQPLPPQPIPPPRQVRDVVTVTVGRFGDFLRLELWFHVDKSPEIDEERVNEGLSADAVVVLAETEDPPTPVELPIRSLTRSRHNVFLADIDLSDWEKLANQSPFLRVVLMAERIKLVQAGTTLAKYLEEINTTASGGTEDLAFIATYVRVPDRGIG